MSVVINTNAAASLAANNLSASNGLLQRSLNRLSSGSKIVNPADDAGGMAVSMKLSAAAKRQGAAASNLGNTLSYLQTQDGVMKTAGKVLERIAELRTLATDPTKNSTDLDNYNAEFTALQGQLSSLAGEKFNGIDLFGSTSLDVGATGDANGARITFGGTDLLGVANSGFSPFYDPFDNLNNWTTHTSGNASVTNTVDDLDLRAAGGASAWATSSQTFSGPFDLEIQVLNAQPDDVVSFQLGGTTLASFTVGNGAGQIPSSGMSTLKLSFDGAGTVTATADGNSIGSQSTSATSGALTIRQDRAGSDPSQGLVYFDYVRMTSTSTGNSDVSDVIGASSLMALSESSITRALQDVATFRAENGAQQSRIGFANEVLATNKANLEAANSRIADVDVAEESTMLARFNILTQAGSAMLAQANQSSQIALRLIG